MGDGTPLDRTMHVPPRSGFVADWWGLLGRLLSSQLFARRTNARVHQWRCWASLKLHPDSLLFLHRSYCAGFWICNNEYVIITIYVTERVAEMYTWRRSRGQAAGVMILVPPKLFEKNTFLILTYLIPKRIETWTE